MAKDGAFFGKQEPNRIIPRRPSHPTREGRRFFAAGTEGEDETDRGRYGDHRGAAVDGFGRNWLFFYFRPDEWFPFWVQVQLGEKQVEVQKAKREKQLFENRAEELTTQKETLEKELADAKASIDEANAAVAQTVDERAQSEAAFAGQNQLLESQVEDWETRYQELMGINNSLTVERDAALQQAEGVQAELHSLQGEYGSLLEEKNSLQASLEDTKNRNLEMESGAQSQNLEIATLQEQKEALETELTALREELARVCRVSRPIPMEQ